MDLNTICELIRAGNNDSQIISACAAVGVPIEATKRLIEQASQTVQSFTLPQKPITQELNISNHRMIIEQPIPDNIIERAPIRKPQIVKKQSPSIKPTKHDELIDRRVTLFHIADMKTLEEIKFELPHEPADWIETELDIMCLPCMGNKAILKRKKTGVYHKTGSPQRAMSLASMIL